MYPYRANRERNTRVVVLLDRAEVNRIDNVGVALGLRSRSEAIRHLVREGREKIAAENENGPVETAISPSLNTINP